MSPEELEQKLKSMPIRCLDDADVARVRDRIASAGVVSAPPTSRRIALGHAIAACIAAAVLGAGGMYFAIGNPSTRDPDPVVTHGPDESPADPPAMSQASTRFVFAPNRRVRSETDITKWGSVTRR